MHFIRYLLLFLALFSPLFAIDNDAYFQLLQNEYPIYVYGDVTYIAKSFDFVAHFMQSSWIDTIVVLGFGIAIIIAGFIFRSGDIRRAAMYVAFPAVTLVFILGPYASVHVVDKRIDSGAIKLDTPGLESYKKISGIPTLLAVITSGASVLRNGLIGINETLSTSDDMSYGIAGYAKGLQIMTAITRHRSVLNEVEDAKDFGNRMVSYIEDCGFMATANRPDKLSHMTNPNKYIFDAISPDELDNHFFKVYYNDKNYRCDEFWNTMIAPHQIAFENANFERIGKYFPDIDLGAVKGSLENTYLNGPIDKMNDLRTFNTSFPINSMVAAAQQRIVRGKNVSGTELANMTTSAASKAKIIGEGAGQFAWLVEVLPMTLHFFFGIVIASYGMMAITLIVVGAERAIKMIVTYTASMIGLFMIEPALALVEGFVNYYAKYQASEILSAIGNPAAIENFGEYVAYLGTMTGIAGISGMAAVLAVPGIVASGGFMAGNIVSGVAGRYLGNDVDTARDKAAEQDSWEKTEKALQTKEAQQFLKDYGLSTPKGVGDLDYANKIQAQMYSLNRGGAMYAKKSNYGNISKGMFGEAIGGLSQQAGAGAEYSSQGYNRVSDSHIASGAAGAAQKIEDGMVLSNSGAVTSSGASQDLRDGYAVQSAKRHGSTIGSARTTNSGEMFAASVVEGADNSLKSVQKSQGLINSMAFNSDGTLSDEKKQGELYKDGLELQARTSANQTQGVGKIQRDGHGIDHEGNKVSLEQMMANVQRTAQAQALSTSADGSALKERYGANLNETKSFENKDGTSSEYSFGTTTGANSLNRLDQSIGSGAGYLNATRENKDAQIQNSAFGTESGISATNAQIDQQGGIGRAVSIATGAARVKASEDEQTLKNKLENAGKERNMSKAEIEDLGKNFGNAAAQVLREAAEEIGDVSGRKAGAQYAADRTSIDTADKYYEGSGGNRRYEQMMQDSSAIRTIEDAGATTGKLKAINSNGGAEAIHDQLLASETYSKGNFFTKDQLDKTFKDKDGNFLSGFALMSKMSELGQGKYGLNIDGTDVSVSLDQSGGEARVGKVDASKTLDASEMTTDERVKKTGYKTHGLNRQDAYKILEDTFGKEHADTMIEGYDRLEDANSAKNLATNILTVPNFGRKGGGGSTGSGTISPVEEGKVNPKLTQAGGAIDPATGAPKNPVVKGGWRATAGTALRGVGVFAARALPVLSALEVGAGIGKAINHAIDGDMEGAMEALKDGAHNAINPFNENAFGRSLVTGTNPHLQSIFRSTPPQATANRHLFDNPPIHPDVQSPDAGSFVNASAGSSPSYDVKGALDTINQIYAMQSGGGNSNAEFASMKNSLNQVEGVLSEVQSKMEGED